MRIVINNDLLTLLAMFENWYVRTITFKGGHIVLAFSVADDSAIIPYMFISDSWKYFEADIRDFIQDSSKVLLSASTLSLLNKYIGGNFEPQKIVASIDFYNELITDIEIVIPQVIEVTKNNDRKRFVSYDAQVWIEGSSESHCQLRIPSLGIETTLVPQESIEIVSWLALLGNKGEPTVEENEDQLLIALDQNFAIANPALLNLLCHRTGVTYYSIYQPGPAITIEDVDTDLIVETLKNIPLHQFNVTMIVPKENIDDVVEILMDVKESPIVEKKKRHDYQKDIYNKTYIGTFDILTIWLDGLFQHLKDKNLMSGLAIVAKLLCPQDDLQIASLFIAYDVLNETYPITISEHFLLSLYLPAHIKDYQVNPNDFKLFQLKNSITKLKHFIDQAEHVVSFEQFINALFPEYLKFINDLLLNKTPIRSQMVIKENTKPAAAQEKPRKLPYGMKWYRGEIIEKTDGLPADELKSDAECPEEYREVASKLRRLNSL